MDAWGRAIKPLSSHVNVYEYTYMYICVPGLGQQKRPSPQLKSIPEHLDDETTNIYIKAAKPGGKTGGRRLAAGGVAATLMWCGPH